MRTLQEKYNAIQEGNFTKDQFLRDARMEQPSLVTQYNGYDDAVKILKNRGMISEAMKQQKVLEEDFDSELKKAIETDDFSSLKKYSKEKIKLILGKIKGAARTKLAKMYDIDLNETRLTNKSLTDYRYKPTNDMDKYPYEQILRGLRVELEGLNVVGTPTPEEYTKALGKVLKNLEKDTIFYTNQVAGVKANAKRADLMIDATPKNEVDKENGLKKAALKEAIKGVIKNILSENFNDPDLYDQDEEREERRSTYNDQGDFGPESDFGDYYPELDEDIYEMQEAKEDSYYKSELSDYLDDNGIYGYTDRIHRIMTGPDEAENVDELVRFLEDNQIYGYNRGIEAIYADYPYDQHWMNQPDKDEIPGFEGTRDALNNLFESDPTHKDEVDDISHPRGYEEASDEETFDDLFKENKSEEEVRAEWEKYQATCHPEDRMSYMEWRSEHGLDEAIDTEADKNMVRKLMTMYETEPSKFEKLHKQAQIQAATTKDIKFKHLLSLLNRAKAGALQSLVNQDRYQAGIEGMDESISLKDIL